MELDRVSAVVSGDVQGVGFRFFVMRNARTLGLRGWVRNREDGAAVEILAEGPRRQLEELLAVVRRGPSGARVSGVDVHWLPAGGDLDGFDLAY